MSCVSITGENIIQVNGNTTLFLTSTGSTQEKKEISVGYGKDYIIGGIGEGAICTIQEYSDNPALVYFTGGDFFLTFLVVVYIFVIFL